MNLDKILVCIAAKIRGEERKQQALAADTAHNLHMTCERERALVRNAMCVMP